MQWKYLRAAVCGVAACAAALAVPVAGTAQTSDSATTGEHGYGPRGDRAMSGPAGWLLAQRDDLKLSDDQVKRLESLRSTYEQQNQPLVDQLRKAWSDSTARPDLRSMSREQRRQAHEQYMAQHPDLAQAMKQLRTNHESARKEALAVLTPEQQAKLREHAAHWREHGDSAGHGGHRGRGWPHSSDS